MIKKILLFIVCLVPWFLSSLIKIDYSYYDVIKKPFFAPPKIFYPISWTIVYLLIAVSIYVIFSSYKFKDVSLSYKFSLVINYLFNQSYIILFFAFKNNFLGFIACLGTLLSLLFLTEETSLLNNKISKVLYPYILLSIFATTLSLTIYLLNV